MRTKKLAGASIALCIAFAGCSGDGDSKQEQRKPPRPNILVILTDDQRPGTVRYMPATRRIFGAGGTNFTNAFATTPQCCPSRASILSGKYAHNHGVLDNDDAPKFDHDPTLQRYLGDAGYSSVIAGKYLNYPGSYYNRERVGLDPVHFDGWVTFLGGYDDPMVNIDGRVRRVEGYTTTLVRSRGLRALRAFERDDDKPWLLYLAPFAPHPPAVPEEKYRGVQVPRPRDVIRERDRSDKPEYVQDSKARKKTIRKTQRRHLRTLKSVDDLVRQVFARMRKLDESRDTFAFFLSDNGLMWGDHGMTGKGFPYNHSVKIPLFVRWPGHIEAGARDDRLAANIDVLATVLDALDLAPAGAEVDGVSLLGREGRPRLLLEHTGALSGTTIPEWASLRALDFHYSEYYEGGEVVFREYYDLTVDPRELENLLADDDAANDPDVERLSEELARARECAGEDCP